MNEKVQRSIEFLTRSSKPIEQFKDDICTHLCMITKSTISYFATWNQQQQIFTMIGWSNSAMINCRMIKTPIIYKLNETGLWGDAIRERKAVITNDYKNLVKPTKKGYPEGHVNVKTHMNLPIYEGGQIVLVAGVGNKPTEYTHEDVKNIEDLMNGVWLTLKSKLYLR
jgi:hypothetical protein